MWVLRIELTKDLLKQSLGSGSIDMNLWEMKFLFAANDYAKFR